MPRLMFFCLCGMFASTCSSDEVSNSAESNPANVELPDAAVHNAVERALPFLESDGVAWMEERNCMSCHHVPFLIWTHRLAESKGFRVDNEKLKTWEAWSIKDSLEQRNLYRLQDYELGKVDDSALPANIREKLKPLIGVPFKSHEEFRNALIVQLTENELISHEAVIVKIAERAINAPDRTGGGLDVLGQLLLSGHGSTSEIQEPAFRDGVFELMQQLQQTDGHWVAGNQFLTMRRWSPAVANQSTTMWAMIALAEADAREAPQKESIRKSLLWQSSQEHAADNHEWLATHVLFLHYFDSPDSLIGESQNLMASQNADGGWGWSKGAESDPYTSGVVLYVLAKVGGADTEDQIQLVRNYLLQRQQSDSSWLTQSKTISNTSDPERLEARDQIYHYWGTAWATLGLIESLKSSVESR